MNFTSQLCTLAITTTYLCVASSPSLAGVIVSESGDTGNLETGVVQDLTSTLDLMTINGRLDTLVIDVPDIDAYKINVENAADFSVTLLSSPLSPLFPLDRILYLFDSDLKAVVADNDHGPDGTGQLSKISKNTLTTSGDYYIVVASHIEFGGEFPLNAAGQFLFDPFDISADDASAGFSPATIPPNPDPLITDLTFDHWQFDVFGTFGGDYQLQFTGLATTSAVVPEPTSALIWAGAGLVMLPTFRRRQRKNRITSN